MARSCFLAWYRQFRGDLLGLGHTASISGKIQAWVAGIGCGRQVHAQEVRLKNGDVAVFVRTQPDGFVTENVAMATGEKVE